MTRQIGLLIVILGILVTFLILAKTLISGLPARLEKMYAVNRRPIAVADVQDKEYTRRALEKLYQTPKYKRVLRTKGKAERAWNW